VNRAALEHLLRAAAAVTGETSFYVVGSAAIIPSWPSEAEIPDVVLRSREADLIPVSGSQRSVDLIDGALGLDSTFDGTFGYYADGVDLSAVSAAPAGWQDRAIRFANAATQGAVGLCMEPHDLTIAKLCAGRDKDLEFVRNMVESGIVDTDLLLVRLATVSTADAVVDRARARIAAYASRTSRRD
jgi:hypothetical protein